MTRGRMSPAVILALLAVLGFCIGAFATEKPIYITKQASPNAPAQTPDPNMDLKEQLGVVPNPGSSVPDFDPNGKYVPRKGPAPPMNFKTGYLSEGFEDGIMPPTGWSVIVNNDYFTWAIDNYNPYEGTYNATCEYDSFYSGTQDEWMLTPVMDFESATTDLKLQFAVMLSYYWAVDPYNNYDVEVWISTDAGATFNTKLWDETALGVFTTWAWYEQTVDLSAYIGEKDVVIGFRYYGYDGAQAGIDAISVNDDPAPSGRCCYGDPLTPSCDYITEAACTSLGGSWDPDLTCADECPIPGPGDNCDAPVVVTLPADMPYADNNYTCGRGNDYDAVTCLGYYDGGEDIIYEITVTTDVTVDIGLDPLGTTWTGMAIGTECPPTNCVAMGTNSGGTPYSMIGVQLTAGTYYLMIDTWPTPDCIPEFNLTITEPAPVNPGDNCTNPLLVKLPDDLPYLTTDSTCGRGDSYNSTCLGSYDGGEDIIYELDVSTATTVNIELDPKGTTYTGISVSDVCPGGATCIATHTNSGGTVHGIYNLALDAGTYFIMIDTWPSPDCIPDFDLSITAGGGAGPENDACADATPVGDVTDLAFNTTLATFDGPGGCQTAPNVWYCYTAPCDGIATISLCGSGYDTKMAVYDGCSCDPMPAQMACNDDFCSLQSEVSIPVVAGNSYLVEVGGYGTNTGTGVLNISTECGSPPPNDNCSDVTPVTITTGVTETFTGNNTFSTGDCANLDPGTTEAWEAFTLTEKSDVTIDYCGTSPSFELVYIVLTQECPCGELIFAASTDWDACGDGNITMYFPGLDAGTYYLPVLASHPSYPTYYYAGPYTIHVLAEAWEAAYCDASGGCDEYIAQVQVADIDNSSGCDGYGDFTGQIANMQFGVGYPITITVGNGYSSDYGGVWVDWNQDYDFDDPGEAITLDVNYGTGPYSGTITPPMDATPGFTRMRVRLNYYSPPPACGATSYGEAEDYTINVGGEVSTLTIDPTSIDFGQVTVGSTGSTELTLGADGGAPINFSIGVEYAAKASYGGGQCDPTLKSTPFQGEPAVPAMEKGAAQLMFEGFEGGVVPPADWTAVVNNAYTWEIDSYNPYEGVYNASCFYDETYSGTQDEWLITPVIDFAGGKYVLDFWWLGSYYWSVDPYNNCDLEVWISTDGGASWLVKIWDETAAGVFDSWTWYNAVVDLSPFKDESNVKLGFHYAGYDGAQFSLDAIALNPAPLSWLSAAPTSGSIPAGGTTPITVSYDASDLDEDTYEANLVITHTGAAKTVDMVPVTMQVGGEAPAFIAPDPVKFYYAYALDPMIGHMYIYDEMMAADPDHTAADIDPTTFAINGDPAVCAGDPDWADTYYDIPFSVAGFLQQYPPMWGQEMMPYTVSGQFTDATPFSFDYEVLGWGYLPGDANLDGMVNIGDAVMLVNYVFKGEEAPGFPPTADANCDNNINIADAVRLVTYIFKGGLPPCHN